MLRRKTHTHSLESQIVWIALREQSISIPVGFCCGVFVICMKVKKRERERLSALLCLDTTNKYITGKYSLGFEWFFACFRILLHSSQWDNFLMRSRVWSAGPTCVTRLLSLNSLNKLLIKFPSAFGLVGKQKSRRGILHWYQLLV